MSKAETKKKLARTDAQIRAMPPQMEASEEAGMPENPVAAQLIVERFSTAAELKQMS